MRIKGFTLIEILSVLAITSMILLLSLGAGFSMTKGFVNTLSAKSLIEFIRTTKNLAIMNTDSPGKYTYAMALIFIPDSKGGFNVIRVPYSITGTNFYKPYEDPGQNGNPTMSSIVNNAINLQNSTDNFIKLYIPAQSHLVFAHDNNSQFTCQEYGIFYEELFGKPHFYCINGNSFSTITGDIHILFSDSNYKLVLSQYGEVFGTYQTQ